MTWSIPGDTAAKQQTIKAIATRNNPRLPSVEPISTSCRIMNFSGQMPVNHSGKIIFATLKMCEFENVEEASWKCFPHIIAQYVQCRDVFILFLAHL